MDRFILNPQRFVWFKGKFSLAVLLSVAGLYWLFRGFLAIGGQTVEYGSMRDTVGFLPVKEAYHSLWFWKTAFYVHVFTSLFALGTGFTQFFKIRTTRLARIHRWVGRISVCVILVLSAPSGLILAGFAEGGMLGRTGFVVLSILWFVTTGQGLRSALQGRIAAHQAWMVRSFALTFSAVTLREWQYWLDLLFPEFDNAPVASWLGWIPNLIVAEIWLRSRAMIAARPLGETDHP